MRFSGNGSEHATETAALRPRLTQPDAAWTAPQALPGSNSFGQGGTCHSTEQNRNETNGQHCPYFTGT